MDNDKLDSSIEGNLFNFTKDNQETGFVINFVFLTPKIWLQNRRMSFGSTVRTNDYLFNSLLLGLHHTEPCDGKAKRIPFNLFGFSDSGNVFVAINSRWVSKYTLMYID